MEIERTLIVPATSAAQARAICDAIPGGSGMFATALSASGKLPATHYVSSGLMQQEIVDAVTGIASIFEGEPMTAISQQGLRICDA